MVMSMCSVRMIILFLTMLHCLQGIYAACTVSDSSSLTLQSQISDAAVIGCTNSSLVMTVGKVKTSRMDKKNNEIFNCYDPTFTASIGGEKVSIMEAKCISKVTCSRPTIDGVHITDIEKQLMYVAGAGETFVHFANYTAGDRIHLKCAFGYGQPKSSCGQDPDEYDYDLYDAEKELPTEGTFTCKDDGKWDSEPVIECREIVCNWTGKQTIDNGKLVGLKKDGKYLLDDKIEAVCDAGFKPKDIAVCQPSGCFSKTTVSCEEIHCPGLEHYNNFENGNIVYSNQPITVNSTATFYCDPDYERFGSDVRTCQEDGSWSNDDCVTCQRLKYANEPPTLKTSCPAPCVPYGAIKEGSSYEIGDTVTFRCHEDFHYLVSVHAITRVCLENAMWTGTDIRCTRRKMSEGLLLGENLENVVNRADQTFNEWKKNNSDAARGRTIDIYKDLQLYLLVDSSGSITDETFEIMKQFLNILLKKIFGAKKVDTRTDVFLRFFGSNLSEEFKFTSLSQFQNLNITRANATFLTKSDTNIPKALQGIMTAIQTKEQQTDNRQDYEPKRVLIVISDGQNNMGGDIEQDLINELHNAAETYSIFVGKQESERQNIDKRGFQLMRKLASMNKNLQDEHFFNIALDNSTEGLKRVIEQMTNVTDPIQCGEYSELTKLNQQGEIDIMTNAEDGAWPWMVNLKNEENIHQCGATLLNENWILTAAHCEIKHGWKIYIGRLDISDTGGNFIETSMGNKNIPHPNYNSITYEYDIRVVKLANSVLFKKKKPYAVPVCLHNATEFPELNYEAVFKPTSRGVVTGWPKQDGALSATLRQLQLRIFNDTICQENANNTREKFNANVNFCALGRGADNKTLDASKGYSGGPFVVKVDKLDSSKRRKAVFIQIGIVSWGFDGKENTPGYYVRLTPEMIKWINDQISEK